MNPKLSFLISACLVLASEVQPNFGQNTNVTITFRNTERLPLDLVLDVFVPPTNSDAANWGLVNFILSKAKALTNRSLTVPQNETVRLELPEGLCIVNACSFVGGRMAPGINCGHYDTASITNAQTWSFGLEERTVGLGTTQQWKRKVETDDLLGVLELFGMATNQGGTGHNLEEAFAIIDILSETLTNKTVAEGWPVAVERVAAKHPEALPTIRTTKQPNYGRVRELLGTPDSTEVGETPRDLTDPADLTIVPSLPTATHDTTSVTWYRYGWCEFGVAGGKIIVLRGNCKFAKKR